MKMRNMQTPLKLRFILLMRRLFLCIVAISIMVSCVRLLWRSWSVEEILNVEQQKLNNLKLRKQELEYKIKTATSSFELERRAREELLLQASDEVMWQRTE
jgi:cell division protein FtsB